MAEEKGGSVWKLPSIVAVAGLVGGLYFKQIPLHSPRPADKAALERRSIGDQTVDARQWQDPFEAVHKYIKEQSDKGAIKAGSNEVLYGTIGEVAEQINRRSHSTTSHIAIFFKLVPGGPYAEDIEVRLRARYAMLSALGVSGYVPQDEEHLGYFGVSWPRGAKLERCTHGTVPTLVATNNPAEPTVVVPFEWFKANRLNTPRSARSTSRPEAVLLLWLAEEDFEDHPLKRLAQLRHALEHAVHHCSQNPAQPDQPHEMSTEEKIKLRFTLFDPRLVPLVEEAAAWPAERLPGPLPENLVDLAAELEGMQVYSAWSTTAEALLMPPKSLCATAIHTKEVSENDRDSEGCRRPLISQVRGALGRRDTSALLKKCGLELVNVTCTDADLVGALIDELALRGVDLTSPRDGVVVLSESDTFYGRALPLTLATEVRVRAARQNVTSQCLLNVTNIANKFREKPAPQSLLAKLYEGLSKTTKALLQQTWANNLPPPDLTNSLAQDFNRLIHQDFLTQPRIRTNIALESEQDDFWLPRPGENKSVLANRRLLGAALGDCVLDCRWDKMASKLGEGTRNWPSNVFRATYFRGVDGLLPGESMPQGSARRGKEKADQSEDIARPFGRSQLDYIPRLAGQIQNLDLEAAALGCQIKAIGVLGSDVYDKILLLQALHDLFPEVIFFTTDLDARLCHPEDLKVTRNLIVASSFDLGLSHRMREAIPPFRDSYQTAQFLSTRVALGQTNLLEALAGVRPRLFEIGFDGPHVLDPPSAPWAAGTNKDRLYPTRPSGWPGWIKVGCMVGGLMLVLVLVGGHSGTVRDFFRPNKKRFEVEKTLYAWLAGGSAALFLSLAGVIMHDHFRNGGEPFSLTAGISLWPTEILRLLAFVLSVFFLIKASYDVRRNDKDLEDEFSLADSMAATVEGSKWERLKRFLTELISWKEFTKRPVVASWDVPEEAEVDARALWKGYKEFGRAPNRCRRYLMAAAIYGTFATLLTLIFGVPFCPYRGRWSCCTDIVLMVLSVGAVFVLLFFVVDATLLCRRLVQFLSNSPTLYSTGVLAEHATRRGLDMKYLDEWLDMRLIARRTKVVGELVYYPFIVLGLMIVAHNSFFDHWRWPVSLLLVFGGLLAYALYCAVALRREAAQARTKELERLQNEFLTEEAQGHKDVAERIKRLINEIGSTEEGAFAPLAQHPVLRVLALPFGSAGLLTGLNFLASM